MTSLPCPICASTAQLRDASHPGYVESERHAIYRCAACDVAFVHPRAERPALYDRIYERADEIPGYERYQRYARLAQDAADPLAALAAAEDVYWGIARALNAISAGASRILEIGSGLGYVTYALARHGHSVTGIDISSIAVEAARRRFGDLFVHADLAEHAATHARAYDAVVACEVIEHLIDPVRFVREALSLVKPGGRLVLTTPNRSLYDPSVLWDTELPPVHFWWFSEASVVALAASAGASVRFVDFSPYQSVRPLYVPARTPAGPTRAPSLTDALAPNEYAREARRRGRLGSSMPWLRTHPLVQRLRGRRRVDGARRTVMCAILEPAAPTAHGRD